MELDITHMIEDSDEMPMLSGSRAELGNDAGKITWNNSIEYARKNPLLHSAEMQEEARDYFADFGAWSREEIAAWSDAELEATVTQYIAGDIREMDVADDYEEYRKLQEAGTVSSNIYRDESGRWCFSMAR